MRLKETFEDIDMYIILCHNLKQHPKYKHLYLNNKGTKIYSLKHNKFLRIYGTYYLQCTGGYHIHRLVAETYIENLLNKKEVNHKDGNKHNNYYKNLEWVTPSENHLHLVHVLNKKPDWLINGRSEFNRKNQSISISGRKNHQAKHRIIYFDDNTKFEFYTRYELLDYLKNERNINLSLSTIKNWIKNINSAKKYGVVKIEDIKK